MHEALPVSAPEAIAVEDAVRRAYAPYFAPHHEGGRYITPWGPTPWPKPAEIARWQFQSLRHPWRAEKRKARPIAALPDGLARFDRLDAPEKLLFNGHATFLIHMGGARVLIDPVLGDMPLVPRQTPSAIPITRPPEVDVVLLTHGHYDHCDVPSLRAIARAHGERVTFVVPVGLASVLPKECARVVEIDWWQQVRAGEVTITFTPAQHWHKRGVLDTNRALWGGWSLKTDALHVYHSGDTGYFEGFEAIERALGAPDLALLPAGAYEPRWFMGPQHMAPEDTLRALDDLNARRFIPIHWGTFDLSDEPLDAGPKLLATLLPERNLPDDAMCLLQPGASLAIEPATHKNTARLGLSAREEE